MRLAGDQSQIAVRLNDGIGPVALDESWNHSRTGRSSVELRSAVQGALTNERFADCVSSVGQDRPCRPVARLEAENTGTFRVDNTGQFYCAVKQSCI